MKRVAAGIDIGGTNTKFGLVDAEGNIYGEAVLSTRDYPRFEEFAEALHTLIEQARAELNFEAQFVGIGIGAPNASNFTGTIEDAANLVWRGVIPVVEIFKGYYPDIPVLITNDANAAAIGEMIYGRAREMTDFIVITLGTGVGSGFVANGKLIYGHDGFAGELGHITIHEGGRECGCGRRGCLETYASATGIKRTIFKLMADSMGPSEFRYITYNDLTAKMITEAALNGDKLAIAAYEHTGMALGKALANAVAVTSPEAIFLLGGLARAGKYIFEPTRRYMEESLFPIYKGKVKLLPSELQAKNAAILGAAALVWHELKPRKPKC